MTGDCLLQQSGYMCEYMSNVGHSDAKVLHLLVTVNA